MLGSPLPTAPGQCSSCHRSYFRGELNAAALSYEYAARGVPDAVDAKWGHGKYLRSHGAEFEICRQGVKISFPRACASNCPSRRLFAQAPGRGIG